MPQRCGIVESEEEVVVKKISTKKLLTEVVIRLVPTFGTGYCISRALRGEHPAIMWPLGIICAIAAIVGFTWLFILDRRRTIREIEQKEEERLAEYRGRAFVTNMRNELLRAQGDRSRFMRRS